MTVHRWFANKSCPGDYLYNLHSKIAAEVTKQLSGSTTATTTTTPAKTNTTTFTPSIVRNNVPDLIVRKGPGTNYDVVCMLNGGAYTIVAESTGKGAKMWGKLKSGVGWIALDYCTKVK